MAKMNTNKSLLLLVDGASLPVAGDYLELQEPLIVNPNPTIEEYKRLSGKLGGTDSYADTDHVVFNETISHKMRHSNGAGTALETVPEYGELLKISGFTETIDTTPGAETVIYTNSQSPTNGSAIIYIDGKKYTLTDTMVADTTFNFEIGKAGMISSALSGFLDNQGIPTDEANPTVTLSAESCLLVSQADIILAGGVSLQADSISISTNADVQEFYALGLKEFEIQDYAIKIEASFYVDGANYDSAMTKLNAQTVEAIDIKLGTESTGNLINGKSVHITADLAKANAVSDSDDKQAVKRTFTWLLGLNGSDEAISIKHGFFA